MNRKLFPLSAVALLMALLVFTFSFTGFAEAYVARSTSTNTRWIARSQPFSSISLPPTSQPPAPFRPAPQPPAPAQPAPLPTDTVVGLNAEERLLFNLVNSERINRGLKPLQLDARLTQLARMKSQDMIDNRYFGHLSPVYGRAGDMIRRAGIPFILAAENIGVGGNIHAIFSAFMNSSGHRNKIIGERYSLTGIGIIRQPGRGFLVTQLFVQPR